MNENRDMKRVNKACCSVQANIMSLMNRDSILLIEDSLKKEQNNTAEKEKQRKLICLALDSGKLSNDLFNKSQTNTRTQTAHRYALSQHNKIINSVKMGEDIRSVKSISRNIATGNYFNHHID